MLFITAIHICRDSIKHFVSKEKVITNNLVFVSLISLLLNILNLKITHSFSHNCESETSSCSHSTIKNEVKHAIELSGEKYDFEDTIHVKKHKCAKNHKHGRKQNNSCIVSDLKKEHSVADHHEHTSHLSENQCNVNQDLAIDHEAEKTETQKHNHSSEGANCHDCPTILKPIQKPNVVEIPKNERMTNSHKSHSCCHSDQHDHNKIDCVKTPVKKIKSFKDVCVHEGHSHKHEKKPHINHFESVSSQSNIRALILHMIFDIASSGIVLISCLLIRFFDIHFFDSVSSFIVSMIIFFSSIPLFIQSIKQISPLNLDFKPLFNDSVQFDNNQLNKKCLKLIKHRKSILYIELDPELASKIEEQSRATFCQLNSIEELLFELKDD